MFGLLDGAGGLVGSFVCLVWGGLGLFDLVWFGSFGLGWIWFGWLAGLVGWGWLAWLACLVGFCVLLFASKHLHEPKILAIRTSKRVRWNARSD